MTQDRDTGAPSDPDHMAHASPAASPALTDLSGIGSTEMNPGQLLAFPQLILEPSLTEGPSSLISERPGTAVTQEGAKLFAIPDHLLPHRYDLSELRTLSPRKMIEYITGDLLDIENVNYLQGNGAFHKLAFLAGGRDGDVSRVTTPEGGVVYRSDADDFVPPEIHEYAAAVGFFRKGELTAPQVLSEAADIVLNLVMLTKLDRSRASMYQEALAKFTNALGFSQKELLLLAVVKYHARYVENRKKDTDAENKLIEVLVRREEDITGRKPLVRTPSSSQFSESARVIKRVEAEDIIPRMRQLKSSAPSDTAGWEDWGSN